MTSQGEGTSEQASHDEVVYVVSHTHWDREWYLPAGRFRQRLVALIDELLQTADPACPVPARRPGGRARRLRRRSSRTRSGARPRPAPTARLEAGPWYVLADELIPSGEALVRNLLAGRRTLARFGATPPPVLYSPDAFGHTAALPLIARGFGFELISRAGAATAARDGRPATPRAGSAADGSATTLFHLPPDGYEFGSSLPAGSGRRPGSLAQRMHDDARAACREPASLLVQNGADHHARQLHIRPTQSRALAPPPHRPSRSHDTSSTRFARELVRRASQTGLPAVAGELRDSYGYTWTLQGTFAHARSTEARERAGGTACSCAMRSPGQRSPRVRGGPSRRAYTNAAWRTVLLSHPHDTLCGCSIDDVARAMDAAARRCARAGRRDP